MIATLVEMVIPFAEIVKGLEIEAVSVPMPRRRMDVVDGVIDKVEDEEFETIESQAPVSTTTSCETPLIAIVVVSA